MGKVLLGLFSHESNSFNPKLMELNQFQPIFGEEVAKLLETPSQTPLHGINDQLKKAGYEIVPTIYARATPGGLVSKEAYLSMKEGFLKEVQKASDLKAVCLHLHGSMTVEEIGDAEGDLLESLREIIGPKLPISLSLDMHATITPKMLKHANSFVGYKTAPHVDMYETGERAASVLIDALQGGYELTTKAVRLPLLVSGEQSESNKPPMVDLIQELLKVDEVEGIATSSYLLGFPWVDQRYSGATALVVSKGEQALAEAKALELAKLFWSKLKEFKFTTDAYPFSEALKIALDQTSYPVCLADCGDNPGAGGSQDQVLPLQEMLAKEVKDVLFGAICDKKAYELCLKQELNKEFSLNLGRLGIEADSQALNLIAKVKAKGKLGTTPAVLVKTGGIDVIITSERRMMLDPKDLEELGIDGRDYKILVLKSGYLDPKYEEIASLGLLVLSSGFTNQNFQELTYKKVQRPIYPLEEDFAYNPNEFLMN